METIGDHAADRDLSSSVGKSLALLGAFSSERPTMGLSELARCAGLSKSTAFRLLAILVAGGLLARDGTRYAIGPRVRELADLAPSIHPPSIRDVALPYLQDLYEVTHETVHLAVPAGAEILYVEKIYGHNHVKSPSRVGGRLNAGCSALGKAMLAHSDEATVRQVLRQLRPRTRYTIVATNTLVDELRRIRRAGVAYDREEAALGLTCVAAPILASDGRPIAAVSVCGPASRFDPERRANAVRRAAAGIAGALADNSVSRAG